MPIYAQTPDQLFEQFGTSRQGLSAQEAARRQDQYGPNELEEKEKRPPWLLFLAQFKDLMILILAGAAILSGVVGDMTDTIIILVILLLNAVIGFVQEFRAEKAMDALRRMTITQARVLRDGQAAALPSSELVPGDVVLLEAGQVVPADLRLLEAHALRADESSLTGESLPVDKHANLLANTEIPIGDRLNMAFKGTLVTNGRAVGIVIATGMSTELGTIARLLQATKAMTPLQARMAKFGKNLSYIILAICVLLFVSGLLRGEEPLGLLLLSVSLAVAAIPEALPALITIALSRGASRLATQHALVRKLPAVETLGSVSFICSDKTGTLTQNKMKVIATEALPDTPVTLIQAMTLNHDVTVADDGHCTGESTETALVEAALQTQGLEHFRHFWASSPRLAEIPFDSDRKCMTTAHAWQGQYLIVTKGAAEAIGQMLASPVQQATLRQSAEAWATQGMRVLAYACRLTDQLPEPFAAPQVETNLWAVGLAGLMDPARQEVKAAIAECQTAGIRPVMITGDHPATAQAIAGQIGLLRNGDKALSGSQLQAMSEENFLAQVEQTVVYARVSPDQKLRIVKALQQKGHFAAMTGDGVNDAPALKSANIGIAMGINGTDVSKEAADLILLDDNFATIVKAVREGRRIFDNIRKFVKYIMACNGAEIWTIFLAPILGLPNPLLPIQILWINLVTDGLPALTLADEPAEKDVMQRPPRPPQESLFADGLGLHIIWVGILMAAVVLGTQAWAIRQHGTHWQTMVFTVLALSQLGHVLAIRSERSFLYQQGLTTNLPLLGAVLLTFLLQLCVIYLPFCNDIFRTQPLSLDELAVCIGLSAVVFHAVELEKWLRKMLKARKA